MQWKGLADGQGTLKTSTIQWSFADMLTQAQKFVLGNLGSNLQHVKIINKNCWGVRKFKLYTDFIDKQY